MQSITWGPSAWKFLHTVSFNYPDSPSNQTKINHKNFYESMGSILPCKYCRDSYIIFLKELPIDDFLGSRKLLTKWLFRIHNKVNNKLRKQGLLNTKNPKFSDICIKYENMRANCSSIKGTCK
jgi:hypothetical protein